MDTLDAKRREAAELRARAARIEAELAHTESDRLWPPRQFYGAYYATTGFMLGGIAAMVSLLVNVVGAPIAGKSSLELIRVYLTFPLGEEALRLTSTGTDVYAVGDGVILAIGCCLYIGTGMLLGVPLYYFLARLAGNASLIVRLIVASLLALALWGLMFYGILSWLQPMVCDGNWITDPQVMPPWVAAVTHLVFGWTLAVLYPLGQFTPYQRPTDAPETPEPTTA